MSRKDDITLWKLRSVLKQSSKRAKGCKGIRVEFWLDDKTKLKLDSIGQFSVVPDVTICLKSK